VHRILPLCPYTTLFRSKGGRVPWRSWWSYASLTSSSAVTTLAESETCNDRLPRARRSDGHPRSARPSSLCRQCRRGACGAAARRSEEHTSELQSRENLV